VDSSTCVNKSFEKVEQTSEHQISQANSSTCGVIEPLKTNLFSTSELQNHTKLAYNYKFKKPCQNKPLQLDCRKWIKHIGKMETKLFGLSNNHII